MAAEGPQESRSRLPLETGEVEARGLRPPRTTLQDEGYSTGEEGLPIITANFRVAFRASIYPRITLISSFVRSQFFSDMVNSLGEISRGKTHGVYYKA